MKSEVILLATKISEFKGKQGLFQRQVPQVLETLQQNAFIQSTESSNRIEGIYVSSKRLESIVWNAANPENRPEGEIAGYRDVLNTIHTHAEHIPLTPSVIQQLHRDLMKYSGTGGRWKQIDHFIEEKLSTGETRIRFKPTPAWRTDEAMRELCDAFKRARDRGDLPDYFLIGLFILDFLCIHPFSDGNGRMARLLTLLLLYQSGYAVGKYISLEKVIEDTKIQYYNTLEISSQKWHDSAHDCNPWINYFLTMLLEAYHRFESRVGTLESSQKRGWKKERILNIVEGFIADFTIADVEELCPGISRPTITKTLNELGRKGTIVCIEHGRHARWVKKL